MTEPGTSYSSAFESSVIMEYGNTEMEASAQKSKCPVFNDSRGISTRVVSFSAKAGLRSQWLLHKSNNRYQDQILEGILVAV
jgi:hypothetical protein